MNRFGPKTIESTYYCLSFIYSAVLICLWYIYAIFWGMVQLFHNVWPCIHTCLTWCCFGCVFPLKNVFVGYTSYFFPLMCSCSFCTSPTSLPPVGISIVVCRTPPYSQIEKYCWQGCDFVFLEVICVWSTLPPWIRFCVLVGYPNFCSIRFCSYFTDLVSFTQSNYVFLARVLTKTWKWWVLTRDPNLVAKMLFFKICIDLFIEW